MPGGRQNLRPLMGRNRGRNEKDLIQSEVFEGILGQYQVARVDRVECTAQNTYFLAQLNLRNRCIVF